MKAPTPGAVFSPCRLYRYTLTREVNAAGEGTCVFCGLNPSTADETADDPTIRREIDYARRWGYRWLVKVNAYAFRATDPKVMLAHPEPVGVDNDAWIRATAQPSGERRLFVAAWGNNIGERRAFELRNLLRFSGPPVFVLKLTSKGHPNHPLYLPKLTVPIEWRPGREW